MKEKIIFILIDVIFCLGTKRVVKEFDKVARIKLNVPKLTAFLCTKHLGNANDFGRMIKIER